MGILNYTDDEVKNWLVGKSPEQIAQQASNLGLNQSQISSALQTGGMNYSDADINNYATQNGYSWGNNGALTRNADPASMSGTNVGANNFYGYDGKSYGLTPLDKNSTSFYGSNGQNYTKQQITDWYNQINPSTGRANRNSVNADVEMMAQLGLQAPDLYKARFLGGVSDVSTGIYAAPWEGDAYTDYRKGHPVSGDPSILSFFDWREKQDPNYLASLARGFTGSASYMGAPVGGTPINFSARNGTPTPQGGANPSVQPPIGPGGGNGGGTSPGTGGSVTPWSVTGEQTVEQRVAGILASGSPLIEQQRAQSDQAMVGRGLLNSSIARTASDAAAYQVALPIAQADAATFAKASGYNADQQNQFVTNDLNRAAQLEIARLNADTSKTIASWGNEQSANALQIQLANKTLLDTNAQAAQAFNTGMSAVNNIQNNASMDGNAKTVAIATVWKNVQTQLRTLSAVSGINISTELQFAGFPGFDDKGRWVGFGDTPAPTVTSPATTPVNEPVDNRA